MSDLLSQVVAAFLGSASFALLFQVPKDQFLFGGAAGAAGWLCYLVFLRFHPSVVLASFAAAILLSILCRVFAVRRKTPITVFLTCGIFPIVPGSGIYYTVYYFIMSQNDLALYKGIETLKIAVAIALGIVLVLSLPYSLFRAFGRKTQN